MGHRWPDRLHDRGAVKSVPGGGRLQKHGSFVRASETHDSFAGLLRMFRRRLSISREEAGRRLGVSRWCVAKWEQKQRVPTKDVTDSVRRAFRLSESEAVLVSRAIEADGSERSRRMSELRRVCQLYTTHTRRKPVVSASDKREDVRLRVRRSRDAATLRRAGILLEGNSRCPAFDRLLEMARANWPDPRLAGRIGEVLVRYADNPPRKQYGRYGTPEVLVPPEADRNEDPSEKDGEK